MDAGTDFFLLSGTECREPFCFPLFGAFVARFIVHWTRARQNVRPGSHSEGTAQNSLVWLLGKGIHLQIGRPGMPRVPTWHRISSSFSRGEQSGLTQRCLGLWTPFQFGGKWLRPCSSPHVELRNRSTILLNAFVWELNCEPRCYCMYCLEVLDLLLVWEGWEVVSQKITESELVLGWLCGGACWIWVRNVKSPSGLIGMWWCDLGGFKFPFWSQVFFKQAGLILTKLPRTCPPHIKGTLFMDLV